MGGSDKSIYARIDGAWVVLWRASTSPMVQRGSVAVNVAGLAAQTAGTGTAVTFPTPFPGTPYVTISRAGSNSGCDGALWSLSASGFSITPRNTQATGTLSGTVTFHWIAVY